MAKIVYSPRYNIGLFGVERLHPFDSRKYGRAWKLISANFGQRVREMWVKPNRPASLAEILTVHSYAYLKQLKESKYVAQAIEIPQAALLPGWVLNFAILRPMRWAVRGTILAVEQALEHGFSVNLGGGFHHAKPARGEGFCV